MTQLAILEYPDPRLRTKAAPVTVFDAALKRQVADMLATMYAAPGIGLAATQVDWHYRLIVIDVSEDQKQPRVFINPEILGREGEAEREFLAETEDDPTPIVLIVAGSIGAVRSVTDLAHAWSIPDALVGVVILAILTSLPNAWTGVRFGLQDRGSALMSETLNSNSINLVAGIAVPAALGAIDLSTSTFGAGMIVGARIG